MSAAAAVIHKQNKLIGFFNEVGAVDPEHAIFIDAFNIRRSYVFERMVSRGVFLECEPGKFYIDNGMVPVFVQKRSVFRCLMLMICRN
jgi:hypothetical protein